MRVRHLIRFCFFSLPFLLLLSHLIKSKQIESDKKWFDLSTIAECASVAFELRNWKSHSALKIETHLEQVMPFFYFLFRLPYENDTKQM